MIQCDHCDAYYHLQCVKLDVVEINRDDWNCPTCR